jgi:2OG-Fe(II) oxygenase superfamily
MIHKLELPATPVSFVGAYRLDDTSICDDLVAYFHANQHLQTQGKIMSGAIYVIAPMIKESVDLTFKPDSTAPEFVRYTRALQECVEAYIADYGFCNANAPWTILEETALQYYPPGGGFKIWHTERSCAAAVNASRHLVFMTYLNTVNDAGETAFYYQGLRVKPDKGLTLIWPADWTHTHQGVPSPTEEKYIITGWFNYRM